MDLKDQFKNIESLSKQLDNFKDAFNKAYSNLDAETYEKVKQQHIDANAMIREFRKGNANSLNDLIEKYKK